MDSARRSFPSTPTGYGGAVQRPPASLGAYDVLFELAHGGMGAVFLARAVGGPAGMGGFERLVAVKRLHLHLEGRAESVQRFLEEAAVAARIHHANVVGIHQVGSDEAGHFLVQDYVEGDTLQGLVDQATIQRRRLPPPVVLRIALDALAGLHAVHEATDAEGRPLGILHRDVSAQNLLVGKDGVTRLADFGIAKHAQSSVVTDGQYLQGRVLYMPPEYLARGPVDRRFDVYGMGVTLYLALAGDVPWPGASDAQIVHLATTQGLPPLSASGLAIAPAIEAIVARACERDPAARFPSARAMLEAIEELGRHTGWIASHGEVAALVDELVGRDLTARRAAVARARGRGEVTAFGLTPGAMSLPAGRPRRAGRWAGVLAGAAGALALGSAALVMMGRAQGPPQTPLVTMGGAQGPPQTPLVTMGGRQGPPQTPLTAAPVALPVAEAGASAAPPAPAPSAEPPRLRASPRRGAAPTVPTGSPPAGPAAPAAITTANPYR